MPTWGKLQYELQHLIRERQQAIRRGEQFDRTAPTPHDELRRKYLKQLAEHTGHPVIVYASGWMENRQLPDPNSVAVTTRDVMGFMEAVHGLPAGPLDLILHSPGGDQNAAEQIMKYLRDCGFGPIRAIVPISAMSAATMMALCCDEILMGRHSQLGPIDPQFTLATPDGPRAGPAQAILDQFERAQKEIAVTPGSIGAWMPILRSYLPALISQCLTAQEAAEEMVSKALRTYMFSDMPSAEADSLAKDIAAWFNDHKQHRSHGRPLRYDEVREKKVKVRLLEEDGALQDAALTAWHGIQLTLGSIAIAKIIENSDGNAWMISGSPSVQIALGPPQEARPESPSIPGAGGPPTRAPRKR